MSVLDLDNPSSWAAEIRGLITGHPAWERLLSDYTGPCRLYQELHNAPGCVDDTQIEELRFLCEDALRIRYACVSAYHACRTRDPSQYQRRGLLSSTRGRLTDLARRLFEGVEGLDGALAACDSYFRTYDGTLSLYTTARFAPVCYLKGSHYLHTVAREWGVEGVRRFNEECMRGVPMFVRCCLPIGWLDDLHIVRDPEIHQYSTSLIKKLIGMTIHGYEHSPDSPSALILRCDVGPEYVTDLIPAEEVSKAWTEEQDRLARQRC
jgi:hypothetical protein